MQQNSNQDSDGLTWGTTALRLGSDGMDLRLPVEPSVLADLVNARFLDERTIERRDGHYGQALMDGSAFPAPGSGALDPSAWVYGHGQTLSGYSGAQNAAYPIHLRGGITFSLGDVDVAWTGDRLLTPQSGGSPAIGASTYWQRATDVASGDSATAMYPRGVPAFLPLQSDSLAPNDVVGDWVDSCLTDTLQVYCAIADNVATAVTINRATGLIIDVTNITGTSTLPAEPSVVNSGGVPVILFRDATDLGLRIRTWTDTGWSPEHSIPSVVVYDIAPVSGGFYAAYQNAFGDMIIGAYQGSHAAFSPFPFGTSLVTSHTPNEKRLALAVAPDGVFGIAYGNTGGTAFDEYTAAGVATGYTIAPQSGLVGDNGLALAVRGLTNAGYGTTIGGQPDTGWEWVLYCGNSTNGLVTIESFSRHATYIAVAGYPGYTTSVRYNSAVISRAFTVGDEVFCWLKSNNAQTGYMLAGAVHPLIAGYADREVAITPKTPGEDDAFNYWPARVLPDPLDATNATWTWTRKFNSGVSSRTGDVLSGDMNFLPHPCAPVYGKSAYLSGSAVKNYDGITLQDAGFQDYPIVNTLTATGSGALNGTYQYLIRAVRYNSVGERFESAALISLSQTTTAGMTVLINTVPSVAGPASSPDTSDIVLEVYRTVSLGSTYYLEGTVANTTAAPTVTFNSIMSDADLIDQLADTHATGIGNPSEIESWGPIGCSVLQTIGDRMWGAGGQLPPGEVQFSKLKDVGFGAGFDDLAGYLQVDNENGTITSIAGQNGSVCVFELARGYVYSDGGPDNDGNGAYSAPQVVLAAGALNHFGTGLCQAGVVYWGIEGPLLLDQSFTVQNISSPMRPLTQGLLPAGVRIDTARMEIVWYCGEQAVLWNYMSGSSRWARWTTPNIASVTNTQALTTDGRLLAEDPAAPGDDGVPFQFLFRTGDIRPEALREGFAMIRRLGVSGEHLGPHRLRMRVYFDGSPGWTEESVWEPETDTWLTAVSEVENLTPTAVDALNSVDHSGAYTTNKRLRRETCHYISIEMSDISSLYQTYIPYELAFEMGSKPGLGRVATNTFTGQGR